MVDTRPPEDVRKEARLGLALRRDHGRGGTAVGIARARDLANGVAISVDTLRRMKSFFARHEVDKQAPGWSPGEKNYPSNGRIAWALWGGDPGRSWANALLEKIDMNRDDLRPSVATRAWHADFNVADAEGRIVSGIAVPYNSPTQIYEGGRLFDETWAPGSTADSISKRGDRMKILAFHASRQMPLGKPVLLEERAAGLYIEARISDTQDGNDALTLVRDGVLDGFSVGFTVPPGGDQFDVVDGRQIRTISRANIHEVSLVNFPAFDDARVESVRAASDVSDAELDANKIAVTHRLQLLRLQLVERATV